MLQLNRSFLKRKKTPAFSELPPEARNQFERLKSHIILRRRADKLKTILFVSYHHGEGTTTVLTHLARSFAQDKRYKILLVDANTRTPSLQAYADAGADKGSTTFSDLFTGGISTISLPKPLPESNLTVVSGGQIVHHPSQVFDHRCFSKFVSSATRLFHLVLFDSSPLGQYYDSIVLGPHVDGVILVVEAEKTQREELRWAKQMLKDSAMPLLGVVLNRRKFRIPSVLFHRLF